MTGSVRETGAAGDHLAWIVSTLRDLNLVMNDVEIDSQTGLLGEGIGLDSFEALELASAIEEHFELTLEDDEILPEHFRSIGALAAFIESRIHR